MNHGSEAERLFQMIVKLAIDIENMDINCANGSNLEDRIKVGE